MTEEELYAMKLHDISHPNDVFSVMRVLGGWIYTSFSNKDMSSCFVPEQTTPIFHEPKSKVED